MDDRQAAAIYKTFEKPPKYKDFRKMLDKEGSGIDAVIVTIPDHMHATAAMHCMERGKHVYVQKPLAHTIWECRQLAEAAKGPYYGPFETAEAAMKFLRREIRKANLVPAR